MVSGDWGTGAPCLFLHTFNLFLVKDLVNTLALSQGQEIKVHISLYL